MVTRGTTAMSMIGNFFLVSDEELQIYPPGNRQEVDPKSDETFGYFSGAFTAVKDLARRGRAAGMGLLVWLS